MNAMHEARKIKHLLSWQLSLSTLLDALPFPILVPVLDHGIQGFISACPPPHSGVKGHRLEGGFDFGMKRFASFTIPTPVAGLRRKGDERMQQQRHAKHTGASMFCRN